MPRPLSGSPKPLLAALGVLVAIAGCRNNGPSQALEECVPGETVIVGCAETCGIGACTGDPVLRFCDGSLGTDGCRRADSSMFFEVDDSCSSLCPRARLTCPSSGSLAIVVRGLSERYTCDFEVDHRGILPPGGRAPETVACTAGEPVEVGCSLGCGLGECEGSVSLRTCDGTVSIADCQAGTGMAIRERSGSSSGCGTGCPEYVVTCPASGSLTVVPIGSGSSGDYVCDWVTQPAPNRVGGTEVCNPGGRYFVGCAAGCMQGSCRGDGVIRVCDGNVTPDACLAITDTTMTLAQENGSTCDSACPQAAVVCPASGAFTVVSFPTYDDEGFGCDWAIREAGIGE